MGGKSRASGIAEVVRTRIRERRLAVKFTQEQLCEKAQISIDAVSRIESGQRVPSLITLESIALALGVTLASLVDAEEARPANAEMEIVIHRLQNQRPEVIEAAAKIVTVLVEAMGDSPSA